MSKFTLYVLSAIIITCHENSNSKASPVNVYDHYLQEILADLKILTGSEGNRECDV